MTPSWTNISTLTEQHIAAIMQRCTLTGLWQVWDQNEYPPEQAKLYGNLIQRAENFDGKCVKARGSA